MEKLPENITQLINEKSKGFNQLLGLHFTNITMDCLEAELEISEQHHQIYGVVHGGVYASIAESLCSIGAVINVMGKQQNAVGLENTTTFLRAVRSGTLKCVAVPLARGRRTHVWETQIYDEQNHLAASGQVRLMILEAKDILAGKEIVFDAASCSSTGAK